MPPQIQALTGHSVLFTTLPATEGEAIQDPCRLISPALQERARSIGTGGTRSNLDGHPSIRDSVILPIDQFGLSCARAEQASLDERLNAARQVHDKIDKTLSCPDRERVTIKIILQHYCRGDVVVIQCLQKTFSFTPKVIQEIRLLFTRLPQTTPCLQQQHLGTTSCLYSSAGQAMCHQKKCPSKMRWKNTLGCGSRFNSDQGERRNEKATAETGKYSAARIVSIPSGSDPATRSSVVLCQF